jgi:hypothetical protein
MTQITAQIASSAHPEEYSFLIKEMTKGKGKTPINPDPSTWAWSYRMAERIESMSFAAGVPRPAAKKYKGRELLEKNGSNIFLSLEAKAGRRRVSKELDNAKLLAGPDEGIPLQMLGVHPRPAGRTVWLWNKPGKDGGGAWRERVLESAVLTPHGVVISLHSPDGGKEDCLMDLTTRAGRVLASWDMFTAKEKKELDKIRGGGVTSVPDLQLLTEVQVDGMFGSTEGIKLDARTASISELLAALRGPGFVEFGAQPRDQAAPAPGGGPWITWDGNETPMAPGAQVSRTPKM